MEICEEAVKRFVDLREAETGYRFAWFDTVTDEFERHSGSMAWSSFPEFAEDFEGEDLERYRGLTPKWAFEARAET